MEFWSYLMAKQNRQKVIDARKDKKDKQGKIKREKFDSDYNYKGSPKQLLQPTPKHQQYIKFCKHKSVVVQTGKAGTGKSYIPTRIQIEKLLNDEVEKIVIVRPQISDSKSLGFFQGDLNEKMKNWILPVLDIFHEVLGPSMTDYLIKMGKIEGVPLETIKGRSFQKSFILAEEAEDLTEKEVVKVITRLGEGSTIVFQGDLCQLDLKGGSGLQLLQKIAKESPHLEWGHVDFNRQSDILRSEAVKKAILEFEKRGLM